jgi:hypothetical protein
VSVAVNSAAVEAAIQPSSGPPGMAFTLLITPSLPCAATIDLGHRAIGSASETGRPLRKTGLTVPASAPPGREVLRVSCADSHGTDPVVTQSIFVVSAARSHRSAFVVSFPSWTTIVPSLRNFGRAVGHSAAATATATLLLLVSLGAMWIFLAFPPDWFNSAWEKNKERIRNLLRKAERHVIDFFRIGKGRARPPDAETKHEPGVIGLRGKGQGSRTRLKIALYLAVGGAFVTILDVPSIRLDESHLWLLSGASIGIFIVTFVFQLPHYFRYRGKGRTEVIGSSIAVAGLCVVASRLLHLVPPYLYGLLCVYAVTPEPPDDVEGRTTRNAVLCVLVLSAVALMTDTWVRAVASSPKPSAIALVAETALDTVCLAGLGTLAFGLVPLPFLPGSTIRRWSRKWWLASFMLSVCSFAAVVVLPQAQQIPQYHLRDALPAAVTFMVFMLLSAGLIWVFHRTGSKKSRRSVSAAPLASNPPQPGMLAAD